jgi:single-stranded-DNA-specific exonuclease
MKRWLDPQPVTVPAEFAAAIRGHPLIAETLIRRGITDITQAQQFLYTAQYTPASPYDLPDMQAAVTRIEQAIKKQEIILIWGDFDVDGQTSTTLLYSALQALNANVRYYIPQRLTEGHGIHTGRLMTFIDEGVQVVLTCDTGISAHEAIDAANERGVDVVITDHHQLPPTLPQAVAAINSQRLPETHPMHTLSGVGVAYKLIEALYAGREDETTPFLDLVALGLVADVMALKGDTRYLVQRGLEVLRQNKRLGLEKLLSKSDVQPAQIDEETIGFFIGPRLNAVGRLDDANISVEFLTTDDSTIAETLANRLEGLNNQRKLDTENVYNTVIQQVEANPKLLDTAVLILAQAGWPGGIVGIVANRLVEQYDRPVVLFSLSDDMARGSARSVAGCDITAAIKRVDAEDPSLITNYGGHTMAAGMGLPEENLPKLRQALSRVVNDMLGGVETIPTLKIGAYLPLADLSLPLLHDVRRLAPFGSGNPPLIFATPKVTVKHVQQLGRSGLHYKLTIEDEHGTQQSVLWWRGEPDTLPKGRMDIAYTLSINEFQGNVSLQVTLVDFRAVEEAPQTFAQRTNVEIIDLRGQEQAAQLAALTQWPQAIIWNEGETLPDFQTARRMDLKPAETLVIWTCPPGPSELEAALQAVNPDRVILCDVMPGTDAVNAFLDRFSGVIKYALNAYHGKVPITQLAGAMGHRPQTIRAGLRWMQARGYLTLVHDDDEIIRIQPGGEKDADAVKATNHEVPPLLQEAKAYRVYFAQASADQLIVL